MKGYSKWPIEKGEDGWLIILPNLPEPWKYRLVLAARGLSS